MLDLRIYRLINDDYTYDEFRSELAHYLKSNTVKDYVYNLFRFKMIENLWEKKEYAKALYLLSVFDYCSSVYGVDTSGLYKEYREYKLDRPLTPPLVSADDMPEDKENDLLHQIFLSHNIWEYWTEEEKKELLHLG